jgi:hypothetical protein
MKLTTHLHLVPRSKNEWSYISTPPYVFMAWCSVKAQGLLYLLPLVVSLSAEFPLTKSNSPDTTPGIYIAAMFVFVNITRVRCNCMIIFHTTYFNGSLIIAMAEFHTKYFSGSLVIAINPKTEFRFNVESMLFAYKAFRENPSLVSDTHIYIVISCTYLSLINEKGWLVEMLR